MKRKVSLAIGYFQNRYGDMEALNIAARLGLDAVDFETIGKHWDYRNPDSIYAKSDEEIVEYCTGLRRHAQSLGIEIGQTHGRITGFRNIPEEDDALIANARLDCLAAAALGAPHVIIHSVTTIHMGADADPALMHSLNLDMFRRILPFARQYGVKIASETFGDATGKGCCDFFGNINEFLKSYNRVCGTDDNAHWMCTCVDTGHSNKATRFNNNPSAGDVIRMLGKHVEVLHLNDNDTLTDQHKPPMTGTLNWNDIFDALDEVGYTGNYNMELNLRFFGEDMAYDMADFSVKLMRSLLRKRYGEQA